MRIKRLSALLLSALLITSPIGYMTVNGDTIDAKDYSQQVQSVDSAYIGSYIPSSLDSDAPVYVSDIAAYAQRNVPSAYPEDDRVIKGFKAGIILEIIYGIFIFFVCFVFAGPPIAIAPATPAILPVPTVAAKAVQTA